MKNAKRRMIPLAADRYRYLKRDFGRAWNPAEPEARFGRRAVARGFLTEEQLAEALEEQRKLLEQGCDFRIGELLLKCGLLTTDQYLSLIGTPPSQDGGDLSPEILPQLGKYRLLHKIAEGGMGVVYKAEDPDLRRHVAIKVLKFGEFDSEATQRLHREAEILAHLHHPNIVTIHEVGSAQDTLGRPIHYIVMDLVQGTTLASILHKGKNSRDELFRIVEEVARAVAHAHGKGVVHRDLKPENIVVESNGRVVLMDFGLAQAVRFTTKLTRSHALLGTPQYMAPEQVEGKTSEIDGRTDVYALGVILYQVLTGRLPYSTDRLPDLWNQIVRQDPAKPSRNGRPVERDLEVICLKAMEKEKRRRYSSAWDFAEDLARFRKGEPIQARPPSWIYRVGRHMRRRRGIVWAASVATVLVAVGTTLLVGQVTRTRSFARSRAAAQEAYQRGDWVRALAECEHALQQREDGALRAMAAECGERIERSRLREIRHREVREKLKSLEPLIASIPMMLYLEGDFRVPLDRMEAELEVLERTLNEDSLVEDLTEAWSVLGIGWYLAGLPDRADRALQCAVQKGTRDDRVFTHLARICLERALLWRGYSALSCSLDSQDRFQECVDQAVAHLGRVTGSWSEIDLALGEAYRALAQKDVARVEQLCEAGLARFKGKEIPIRVEEFHTLLASIRPGPLAIAELSKALQVRPNYPWGYLCRGSRSLEAGELDSALSDFSRAVEQQPRLSEAHNDRGVVRFKRREWEAAVRDFSEAIRLDPQCAFAESNLGLAMLERGETEEAILHFDRAIQVDPRFPRAWSSRGWAKGRKGDREGAIQDLTHAIALCSHHALPYSGRAEFRAQTGDLEGAMDDYGAAIRLDPKLEAPRMGRAAVWFRQNNFKEAIEDLDVALEGNLDLDERARALADRGAAWARLKDPAAAIRDLDEAIRLRPDFALAYYNRGEVRKELGQSEAAEADFLEAIRCEKGNAQFHQSLGTIRKRQKKFREALEGYDEAIRLKPDFAAALLERALCRHAVGEIAGALEDLRRCLQAAPADWEHRAVAEELLRRWSGD